MMETLYSLFGGVHSGPYVNAVVFLVGVLLLGFLLHLFLDKVFRRLARKTSSTLDDALLAVYLPQVKWLAIIIGLNLSLKELRKGFLKSSETSHTILSYTADLVFVAGVLVVVFLVARTVSIILAHFLDRYSERTESDLSRELTPLLQRIVMMLAAVVGIIVMMERFGIPANSLLVFLGGGSVAIALAAQDTLSNMIAGFVIMIDRPFRVGDRIKLPAGAVGDVYEIGLRSTKIMDFDHNLIISPNAELIKSQVINYAYPHRLIRVLVEVSVAYGTDIGHARTVLVTLAREHRNVLPDHPPTVYVVELGDSGVLLRLIARTDDFTKKFEAETELREQIHERFAAEGISIPFPQRVVHLAPESNGTTNSTRKRGAVRRKNR